ncbi:MAG: protein kinase [Actinomycetota bacterium]|nr:protein kinase [Actinomycetota bacterium]
MQGQVIKGRYKIDKPIGRGGMATVYRAFDMVLNRPVAVKILHVRFTNNAHFVERFKREAHSAAGLIHRNIATIYDTGYTDGIYYIVMEYINGKTLKELIDEHAPFSATTIADIARQVVDALAHAHSKGIIHRDIKPQNILITVDKIVKVSDFGIARALAMPGLTQNGRVLGTARYISPEQARGKPADHRSDLYSLGVILFEMATGEPPFAGASSVEIAGKHVAEFPKHVREVNPKIPIVLEVIIDKLMRKEPSDRYESAEALLEDLEYWDSKETRDLMRAAIPKRLDRARTRRARRTKLTGFAKTLVVFGAFSFAVIGYYGVGDRSPAVVEKHTSVTVPAVEETRVETERIETLLPVEVVDYDPEGNGDENPSLVARIIDGDDSTGWTTESYRTANFGKLKDGTGVYMDFGKRIDLKEMTIVSSGGWSGAVKASDDVLDWTTVKEIEGARQELSVKTDDTYHRYYLIWITDLPPVEQGKYRGSIFEIRARGKAY